MRRCNRTKTHLLPTVGLAVYNDPVAGATALFSCVIFVSRVLAPAILRQSTDSALTTSVPTVHRRPDRANLGHQPRSTHRLAARTNTPPSPQCRRRFRPSAATVASLASLATAPFSCA